jgi:DNA (cytosine-5)-methyltransferase 1
MIKYKPKVLGGIGEKKSNNGTQWYQQDRIYDNKIAISVTTSFLPYYFIGGNMNDLKIRKLTPKECWRLMGFDDKDVDKASKVNSNTQLYKQAGNSIVVNVLEGIFNNLLLTNSQEENKGQLSIFDIGA